MPVIAYSSLGRGMLTGKLKSTEAARVKDILDRNAVKAYASKDNFERLKRCEEMAGQKGCTVAQIATAWLLAQPLNTFAIAAMSSPKRIKENAAAFSVSLSEKECSYLNLEQ